jgi:hypothetical protein
MLAIVGFFVFLAGGALAYSAETCVTYRTLAETVAGWLLLTGLLLLGINLEFTIGPPT